VFNAVGLGEQQVQILASDISGAALERGRSGQYRDWSLRSLSAELREQYFRSENGVHHIRDDLRRNVVWKQLNLAKPSYPSMESGFSHFGLIFCRNVLMFFDAKTIQQVAMRLYASLLPGGWLVLGPSDPNISQFVDLEVHVTPSGLMYRRPTDAARFRRVSSLPPLRAAASELAVDQPVVREERRPAAASAAKKVGANACELAEQVRAACNERGAEPALRVCEAALARCEDAIELHHLQALLLWDLRRFADAAAAMRRVLYLDSDNAVAHFGLASLLERQGSLAAARRSYQNALHACEDLAADAPLPLGDGICASGLQAAARDGLTRLRIREAGKS
jgi:chemotaxis protein methyltransferase CheR